MSRIIVKNLPKKITEEKLREIFSQQGTITDVQLKYTSDGKFRQFAFIGYHNEDDAKNAINSCNKICINTNKITVEPCASIGDLKKPKSWSKYASDSSSFKKNNLEPTENELPKNKKEKIKTTANNKTAELLEKYKDDPLFEEFLEVHSSKDAFKLISEKHSENKDKNDSAIESDQESESNEEENDESTNDEKEGKLADQNISDMEYMKKFMKKADSEIITKPRQKMEKKKKEFIPLYTVKLQGLPYNCKKKDIKQFFEKISIYSLRIPRKIKGIAYAGFKTEKSFNKALIKDKSFMNGKQISVVKYKSTENTDQNTNYKVNKWKNQVEALKHEEDIAESGRIFLRNLSYTVTEKEVEELFSEYGPLVEVNLPIDSTTRKMKGFGIVTFLMPEHAVQAYTELDGSIFQGRMLHLLPGKAKDKTAELDEDTTNYKKKKSAQQKAQAGSSHNWNSLFLGHDAVAEVIADTYGTSKERVLNPHGDGSAAVRLALGETQIVAATRKYLEQEGVILDAFDTPAMKRSKTVILVKNLPSHTEVKEIITLFERYGELGRVILPPSGVTAIVEFFEPSEARKAFTRLAYSKFKNLPLYLEWAPENSLLHKINTNNNKKTEQKNAEETKEIKDSSNNQINETNEEINEEEEEEEEEEPEPDTTLFVKNLNFETSDENLRKHFESCGKIHYATVARKKDKNNPSNSLSMGYGFVRFIHRTSADKALKTLQQSCLDDKSLELKRSERILKNDVVSSRKTAKKSKQTGTKILIRNVPFQANKNEIYELFKTFGEIKACRLPRKLSGGPESHRGFGFVDFVTNSDAKKAFEALCQSTHLYGRRLVLEWASVDEGVDQIRKRTSAHFKPSVEVKSKKSVFDMENL